MKVSLPVLKGYSSKDIIISGLDKLSFNFTNKEEVISKEMTEIPFLLSGGIEAVWNPNKSDLKLKLVGINKDEVLPVFGRDEGISSAIVKIFPPWQ